MQTEEHIFDEFGKDMPGGFFIYRAGGSQEILYVNDVVLDIFGCGSREEFEALTGNTFRGMVYQEDYAGIEESIERQVGESGRMLDYVEYRIRRKDGTIRWVDDSGRLVKTNGHGDVYYVLIRDITEVHDAREENLRRLEVIEGLSIDFKSIYLVNLDTGTMRPYRIQGSEFASLAEETADTDWRKILPLYAQRFVVPEDRAVYLREIREDRLLERISREHDYSVKYRCVNKQGGIKYMEMSVTEIPSSDKEGGLRHHAVIGYRDVTSLTTQVQEELSERLNMEMELEREKHSNEIKSSFLFNLSHDIRTPMNAIMGFTSLAERHVEEPEKLKDYLSKVDESGRVLMTLIDDMLEMSRIDYGKIEIKTEPADLRSEIEGVLDMFRPAVEEKELNLLTELNLPSQDVYVDKGRFQRILSNLIGNAVKFTLKGGTIRVSARQKGVSGSGYSRFEFVVADNGIGMTEDFMRKMYDAFEKEENSTKTGFTGTGLGLAITKRLLDIMGGSISVKSSKGKGSTFTIDLPLKLKDPDEAERPVAADPGLVTQRGAGEHRILLVEDIEMNRMLAEHILRESGFLVESVEDGSDAVELISHRPAGYFDLVLMDIQMPVMNGYEAARRIRALGREDTADLPIIALSANARDEDRKMSMEAGMNSHVAKPFDIDSLVQTIHAHISERGQ